MHFDVTMQRSKLNVDVTQKKCIARATISQRASDCSQLTHEDLVTTEVKNNNK